jgi:hypothetical protein
VCQQAFDDWLQRARPPIIRSAAAPIRDRRDVTELTALARDFAAGPAATRPLAARVTQLAGDFEFGALQELASSL